MMRRFGKCSLLCALLFVTLTGCATLDPRPYEAYRDAFHAMRASSDKVLAVDYEWTYRESAEKLAAGEDVSPADLILQFPVDDYDWELPVDNLLAKVRRTQDALSGMNAAFAEYTELLAGLAGGGVSDSTRLNTMAGELNERAGSAAAGLGFDQAGDNIALFSAAATALAREYLNHRRESKLRKIVTANQADVETFAGIAGEGVRIIARDLKAEYQNQAERLLESWPSASAAAKKRLAKNLLDLNADVIAYLEALRILDDGYALLAKQHADLARTGGEFNTLRLLTVAEDLDARYEDLR